MISSSVLALSIYNDLDQNGYTTWYDDPKILETINDAVNFVLAYTKWPWTLTSEEVLTTAIAPATVAVPVRTFTLSNEIFYPYRAYLDEELKTQTNIPITPIFKTQD